MWCATWTCTALTLKILFCFLLSRTTSSSHIRMLSPTFHSTFCLTQNSKFPKSKLHRPRVCTLIGWSSSASPATPRKTRLAPLRMCWSSFRAMEKLTIITLVRETGCLSSKDVMERIGVMIVFFSWSWSYSWVRVIVVMYLTGHYYSAMFTSPSHILVMCSFSLHSCCLHSDCLHSWCCRCCWSRFSSSLDANNAAGVLHRTFLTSEVGWQLALDTISIIAFSKDVSFSLTHLCVCQ